MMMMVVVVMMLMWVVVRVLVHHDYGVETTRSGSVVVKTVQNMSKVFHDEGFLHPQKLAQSIFIFKH